MIILYWDTLSRLRVRPTLFFVSRKRSSLCVKVTELPIGYSNASETVICIFTVDGSGVMVSIIPQHIASRSFQEGRLPQLLCNVEQHSALILLTERKNDREKILSGIIENQQLIICSSKFQQYSPT